MNKKHQKKIKKNYVKFISLINKYKYEQALSFFKFNFPTLLENLHSPNEIEILIKENPKLFDWLPDKKDLSAFEYFLGNLFNIKKDCKTAFIFGFLLTNKFPDDFSVNAGFGQFCSQLELVDMAEKYFYKAEKINPNESKNLVNLGNILLKKSNIEEAHYLYKKAYQQDSSNIIALTNLAMSYLKLGENTNYEKLIKKALEMSPSNIPALLSYGQYQYQLKNLEGLKQIIANLEHIDKESPYIYWLTYLLKTLEHKDASNDLEMFFKKGKAQGGPPPMTSVHITNTSGLDFYEKAIEKMKDEKLIPNWYLLYQKGLVLFDKWEITDSKKHLLESLEENANNPDAKIHLLSILLIENDIDGAKKLIETFGNFTEYSPRLKCYTALISMKENNFVEAKNILSVVLELDPKHFFANYLMGQLFFREKSYLQAKIYLSNIIPAGDPHINFLFGRVLLKLDETLEAIKYFSAYLNFINNNKVGFNELFASIYFYLGNAYFKINKIKKAINNLKVSLKYQENFFCLNDLAIAFIQQKSFSKGNRLLIKSLKLKPDYGIALQNMNKLKPILQIQSKYFLSLFLTIIFALILKFIDKDGYALLLSAGTLILIITKKLKAGVSFSYGDLSFGITLGEYDFNVDEKLSPWILSRQGE